MQWWWTYWIVKCLKQKENGISQNKLMKSLKDGAKTPPSVPLGQIFAHSHLPGSLIQLKLSLRYWTNYKMSWWSCLIYPQVIQSYSDHENGKDQDMIQSMKEIKVSSLDPRSLIANNAKWRKYLQQIHKIISCNNNDIHTKLCITWSKREVGTQVKIFLMDRSKSLSPASLEQIYFLAATGVLNSHGPSKISLRFCNHQHKLIDATPHISLCQLILHIESIKLIRIKAQHWILKTWAYSRSIAHCPLPITMTLTPSVYSWQKVIALHYESVPQSKIRKFVFRALKIMSNINHQVMKLIIMVVKDHSVDSWLSLTKHYRCYLNQIESFFLDTYCSCE